MRPHGLEGRQEHVDRAELSRLEQKVGFLFCAGALKRGVYLHPTHTMFLSVAHGAADIDGALEATDGALEVVAAAAGWR